MLSGYEEQWKKLRNFCNIYLQFFQQSPSRVFYESVMISTNFVFLMCVMFYIAAHQNTMTGLLESYVPPIRHAIRGVQRIDELIRHLSPRFSHTFVSRKLKLHSNRITITRQHCVVALIETMGRILFTVKNR